MPIYNGAATLEKALASIRAQSFEDFEILLHDDGSSDASPQLIARLAREDERLRSSRSERNEGLGAAMARLCQAARGEYLAIQEQDDISLPDRLATEVALLDAEPEVGLVSGIAEWLDHEGGRLRLFPGLLARGEQYPQEKAAMVRYLFLEQCKVVNAGALFRRQLLSQPSSAAPGHVPVFFDREARMSVDWQFFLRLAHGWRIHGLPQIVVQMARGAGRDSLTRRKELQFTEARRCLALLHRELADSPASPIDDTLYGRAMASQLLLEGRYWGGGRGLWLLLAALRRDPRRGEIWRSLFELTGRGLRRLLPGMAARGAEAA